MGEGGDHVLDGVAEWVAVLVVHLPGVAHEAFFFLLLDTGVKGVTLSQTSPKFWFCPDKSSKKNTKNSQIIIF